MVRCKIKKRQPNEKHWPSKNLIGNTNKMFTLHIRIQRTKIISKRATHSATLKGIRSRVYVQLSTHSHAWLHKVNFSLSLLSICSANPFISLALTFLLTFSLGPLSYLLTYASRYVYMVEFHLHRDTLARHILSRRA